MHTTSIWAPCSGCPCPNHYLPSCTFTVEPSLSDDPEWMHLTRSNNPPSQYEEIAISAMISAYDEQIQSIDLEKSSLEAFSLSLKAQIIAISQRMDVLQQERSRVAEAVRERQNLLSPVRRLSPEILSHIFLDTVDFPVPRTQRVMTSEAEVREQDKEEEDKDQEEDVDEEEEEEEEDQEEDVDEEEEDQDRGQEDEDLNWDCNWEFKPTVSSLWSFTRVSTQWRSVCLSSPRLWSYVNILITDSNFENYSYTRQLGLQLDRSAKCPLSISICHIEEESTAEYLPPQLVAILFSFSSCIRELHLYLPSALFQQMSLWHLSLPSLENLVLLCTDGIYPAESLNLRLLSFAPKLQSLEVVDLGPQERFELPWVQLKKYRSDYAYHPFYPWRNIRVGPRPHDHLKALRKLQQVEECTLRLGDRSEKDEFGNEVYPLICPQLHMLDISSWNLDDPEEDSVLRQVADRLLLPGLSFMKVSCSQRDSYEGPQVFSSICRLLQRSQSPITVLHFDHGRVLTEDLLQFFRSTPTLEDLRLTRLGDVFTKEVMEKLTVDHASSELLLPRLRTLYIGGGVDILPLVLMVQSRRSGGHSCRITRLQTLRLCGNFPDPCPGIDAIISRLKQYYAEGFSFGVCRTVL